MSGSQHSTDSPAALDDRGRFCRWYPALQAERFAPAAPGVFQLRQQRGLLPYPTGKSAMVLYGWAPQLRAAVRRIGERWADEPAVEGWLCRHQVVADAAAAEALHRALLDRFTTRFGAPPSPPCELPSLSAEDV